MRVLIADDEPSVRLLLSRILVRDFDCAVTECRDGIEVLDLLPRHRYDLLIIDLMLPVVSGLEVLAALRQSPDFQRLPVAVVSAARHEAEVRQAVRLGISDYIAKPLRPSDVAERLNRVIANLTAPHVDRPPRSLAGLPAGARLLVVDEDRDYRHFVRSTLGHEYLVTEADSAAQGLRLCLDRPPSAIIVGPQTGMLSLGAFLRKLRQQPALAAIPLVLAGTLDGDIDPRSVDACLTRSFVPQTLRDQFQALVTLPPASRSALDLQPDLWRSLLSATEQVFGMMLGVSVLQRPEAHQGLEAEHDIAYVTLTQPDIDDVAIGLAAPREASERMTQAFLQSEDRPDPDDVAGTIQELANMLGGRVLDGLKAHGGRGTMSLPLVTTVSAADGRVGRPARSAGFVDAVGHIRCAVLASSLGERC